jgi:hypothetical protein
MASQDPSGQGQKPGEGQQPGQEGKGQGQGQQPGQDGKGQQGQTASQGQGKGQGEGQGQQGQQPGQDGKGGQTASQNQSQGQGEGQGQGQGQQQGQGQGGSQTGATAGGRGNDPRANNQEGDPNSQREGARLSQLGRGSPTRGGIRSGGSDGGGMWGGGTEGEQAGPLTGDRFTEWSDRLRNVEEMVDDPNLRTEIARVREIAKGVRVEFKRHSLAPNWDMVNTKIRAPLAELRNRLTEELARRDSKESLVPIDRDPVPVKYAERVRRYYEDLGRSDRPTPPGAPIQDLQQRSLEKGAPNP